MALLRAAVRRGVLLTVALGLAGVVAGGWWGHRQDSVHEATAVILTNPLEGNPFSPDGSGDDLVNLETEAQLVTSDGVGRLVAEAEAGHPAVAAVLDGVEVVVPPNTQILEITVSSSSPETAVRRAQSFAETYLAYRQARSESAVFDRLASVREQIREASGELNRRVEELNGASKDSPRALLLQQQILEVTGRLSQLRTALAALETTPANPGQVVTPAALDGAGALGMRELAGIAGLCGGLGLGLAIAVARVRRDSLIRDPEDLEPGGPPLLGTTDDLSRLRSALLGAVQHRPLVALVASATEHSDATHCVPELGRALSRSNFEVVLVDVTEGDDGDHPSEPGLTDVLQDLASADEVIDPRGLHLGVISGGRDRTVLDDLVAAPEMALLLEELRKRADVVLIRGAALDHPRSQALVPLADTVLVEVEEGGSTYQGVARVAQLVELGGGALAGLAYVPAPPRVRRRRWWRR